MAEFSKLNGYDVKDKISRQNSESALQQLAQANVTITQTFQQAFMQIQQLNAKINTTKSNVITSTSFGSSIIFSDTNEQIDGVTVKKALVKMTNQEVNEGNSYTFNVNINDCSKFWIDLENSSFHIKTSNNAMNNKRVTLNSVFDKVGVGDFGGTEDVGEVILSKCNFTGTGDIYISIKSLI